jgi:hypothetical protein
MDPRIRVVFFALLLGFTGLYFWVQSLRVRVARVEHRMEERRGSGNVG